MTLPSIGDYAAIGDCRSLALVSRAGSIDWCCLPEFNSPSVFAALLDAEKGGRFAMTLPEIRHCEQRYLPHSNVLLTRIEGAAGVLELTDFMVMPADAQQKEPPQQVVRIAQCTAGRIELGVQFDPRPDYALHRTKLALLGPQHWHSALPHGGLDLQTTFALEGDAWSLTGQVAMNAGDVHAAVLGTSPLAGPVLDHAHRQRDHAVAQWTAWCAECAFDGPYAADVRRSALTLKLLTHRPTGALVAAGTTSIPESETGKRNWDYRFCWLRDSSLVFDAFTELGYEQESGAFLKWLLHATHRTRPRLQMLYDMYGGHELEERILPHLAGYHGIGPVRIGNAASGQEQHDVYGEVLVTAYDWVRRGGQLDAAEKRFLASFAQVTCDVWRQPDNGIWEIRSAPRHNTHSKLMCWAALDRTLLIHALQPLPIDAARVAAERDAAHADIVANGWNDKLGSYVGFYGSDAPDAALLLMPRLGFHDPRDARLVGTVECIQRELSVGGMLYRYPPGERYDGVAGGEHLFAICSFWCVDALARQGRIDEATALFERLLALRTPAGLYAEEFDVRTGAPVGNFPQAFSHVGLITAAIALQACKAGDRSVPA